jgi:hypothetical protein
MSKSWQRMMSSDSRGKCKVESLLRLKSVKWESRSPELGDPKRGYPRNDMI